MIDRSRTFHGLDALRGIAAMIVLTRHAPAFFGTGMFPGSSLAVDLFFVMSGFVIAHAYDRRFEKGMSAWEFMKARLIRLYPLYILGTLVGAAVAAASMASGVTSAKTGLVWTPQIWLESFLPSLFMLPAPPIPGTDGGLYPLNAVAWSLLYEMIVNLVYVAIWRYTTNTNLIVVMIVAAIGLTGSAVHFGVTDLGWNWENWPGGIARVFYSFPAGVLAYRLWADGKFSWIVPWWLPVIMVILAMVVPLPEAARIAYEIAIILVAFPCITVFAVNTEMPRRLIGLAHFLGLTSYAVYALHRPFLSLINGAAQVAGIPLADYAPLIGIPFLILFVAGCWLVDKLYDQPVRRFLAARLVTSRR